MSITNYWFQLIWLLTVGMVLAISLPKKQEIVMGRIEERWQIAPAVLLVVPYILAATLRSDNFGDTYAYRSVFREAPSKIAALPLYLEGIKKDKGFSVLIVIIKALIGNSPILFFMFIATVQMLCMAFIYRKYSENYWMSIFVFVAGTDYMSWCHNGIRQFLAIAIIMAGFPLLLKRKYIPLIAIILLGATFHASALLMIPIIFIVQGKAWNKKSVLCILGCILILIFVNQFTDGMNNILSNTQYSNMVADWKEWEDNGTNPIRVFVYSIPMILCMVRKEAYDAVKGYTEKKRLLRVEDYHLWIKMYEVGYRGKNIPKQLYLMRDDKAAYKRRKFRYRVNEAYVRGMAVRKLGLPISGYLYAIQPIIIGILPKVVYDYFHKRKLESNSKKNNVCKNK